MSISLKTQKMLWGRAAGRCSMPDCRIDLYEDETETDDPTLVGENCHIVAESDDGPRADPAMSLEQRNSYANLILLCRNHHKVIDAQEGYYTVQRLHEMKKEYENWVRIQLGFDSTRQRDDEQYAGMIDTWQRLAHLDEWRAWSSSVLSNGQPSIRTNIDRDLYELRNWLLNRIWPERYTELENAFHNFHHVLSDFQNLFREYAEPLGEDRLLTRKFYRTDRMEEGFDERLRHYAFHVDLVQDLMLELTRSANLICDRTRQYLMSTYRLNDGHLVIESGPMSDLTYHTTVVKYEFEERSRDFPYPGLQAFLVERAQRDIHYGEGTAS